MDEYELKYEHDMEMGEMIKNEMLAGMRASKAEFVTYGNGDLGIPVKRLDAIADIEAMSAEDFSGGGTWYECDADGNIL